MEDQPPYFQISFVYGGESRFWFGYLPILGGMPKYVGQTLCFKTPFYVLFLFGFIFRNLTLLTFSGHTNIVSLVSVVSQEVCNGLRSSWWSQEISRGGYTVDHIWPQTVLIQKSGGFEFYH